MSAGSQRGGVGRGLLIFLVVLVAVLVALDRVGDAVAERFAADTIQSNQHLAKRPDVNITGFPFLTQLAAGNFDKIIVTADDVSIGSGSTDLQLSTIQITLHHVHVARDLSSVHADTADAVATMTYAELGRTLGDARIRYDGGGRITAAKSIDIFGQRVSGAISARPQLENDTLSFGEVRINGVNQLIAQAGGLLAKAFDIRLPLSGIPFDVRVRSLNADQAGLHLTLVGRNLSYSR
jgi:hypothetical protein